MSDVHDCGGCPIATRRDFLRDALGGALVAIGLAPVTGLADLAAALPATRGRGARTDKIYPIPAADGVAIDKDESVIIARAGNRVWAFSLACPHQNTAIRWQESEHRFQCPKHKSRYRPDGTFIEGRATRGLDRFAVRRDGNKVAVNLDLLYREDENPNEWASAFLELVAPEK